MKPEIGQQVYSLNINNAARHREQVLTPCIVTKVGRKYFTARRIGDDRGYSDTQYHLDSWVEKTEASANSRIYADPQEWEDEKEYQLLFNNLCGIFSWSRQRSLSLDKLREITEIISR